MRILARVGPLALVAALQACGSPMRENVFVAPLFGAGTEEGTRGMPGGATPAAPTTTEPARVEPVGLSPARSPIIRESPGLGDGSIVRIRPPIRVGADGTITMSFERIGIADFARAVFGEMLGLNYTVDPGVAGAVSLEVGKPVPRDAVFTIATRALAAVGVAVRRDGDLVVVEPDPRGSEARAPATSVLLRALLHVDASQVTQAAQPFLAPDSQIGPGPLPGTLILSGSEDGVRALSGLVDALDIDPLANRNFALFPLAASAAAPVAEELQQILGTGGPRDPTVISIDRINAVLVITDSMRALREAEFWVKNLDESNPLGNQIHVYQVQNRRAKDLADLLRQTAGRGDIATAGTARTSTIAPGLTEVALGDDAGAESLDAAQPAARGGGGQFDGVSIFADEGTNSIMIVSTPERYAVIEAALRRLDVQPVQVLIEATIIEVKLSDELRYGVRWFFENGEASYSYSGDKNGAIASVVPGFNFVLDSKNLNAVVSALDSVTDVQVVSSPSLMVLNNETARLQVGDQVPTATATLDTDTLNSEGIPITRNEIEYRDTGVILEVTPRVNASGVVLLDIVQDVSEVFETDTSGIDSPTIGQRRFESSVLLRDRETVALGGLIRTRRSDDKSGVPILSDIPIIGALFGETGRTADRTELLVVIRPIVVRNHFEARAAYLELRSKLSGLEKLSAHLPQN